MYSNGTPFYFPNPQMTNMPMPLLTGTSFNQQSNNNNNNQGFFNNQIPSLFMQQPMPQSFVPQHNIRPLFPHTQTVDTIRPLFPTNQIMDTAIRPLFPNTSNMDSSTIRPLLTTPKMVDNNIRPLLQQQNQPTNLNMQPYFPVQSSIPSLMSSQSPQQQKTNFNNRNNNNNNSNINQQLQKPQETIKPNAAKNKSTDSTLNTTPAKVFRFGNKCATNKDLKNDEKIQSYSNNNNNNNNNNSSSITNDTKSNVPSLLSLKLPPPPLIQGLTSKQTLQANNNNNHKNNNLFPILNDNNIKKKPDCIESLMSINEPKHKTISIYDILKSPGRETRPSKIVILLRGLPGSGKSYLANLIKQEEEKISASKPKILSIDNYFMCEKEDDVVNGVKNSKLVFVEYEYDESMNEAYQRSLVKSFKKTVDDYLFDFIIVDMINEKMTYIEDMQNYAKSKGFQVFLVEMAVNVDTCVSRNTHKRTQKEIENLARAWEKLPFNYIKLDCRSVLQDDAIENVEMDDAVELNKIEETKEDSKKVPSLNTDELNKSSDENDDDEPHRFNLVKSKWETQDMSEDQLNRLDGIAFTKLSKLNSEQQSNITLDSYLEMNLNKTNSNSKKRVKWKDFEEEKRLIKQKELGFVIGQSAEDWKKMTDDNYKTDESALKTYKYI